MAGEARQIETAAGLWIEGLLPSNQIRSEEAGGAQALDGLGRAPHGPERAAVDGGAGGVTWRIMDGQERRRWRLLPSGTAPSGGEGAAGAENEVGGGG